MTAENIQKIAFDLFRLWKEKVNYEYPDDEILILDERSLVDDLTWNRSNRYSREW